MKKTFYNENYVLNLILKKNLLINYYTKSLIRFSKKRNCKISLDNYTSLYMALLWKTDTQESKISLKTEFQILPSITPQIYKIIIPGLTKIEYDNFYIDSILNGLQSFYIHNKISPFVGLVLKPFKNGFFSYCLGVIGKFKKMKSFLNQIKILPINSEFKLFCIKRTCFFFIQLKIKKPKLILPIKKKRSIKYQCSVYFLNFKNLIKNYIFIVDFLKIKLNFLNNLNKKFKLSKEFKSLLILKRKKKNKIKHYFIKYKKLKKYRFKKWNLLSKSKKKKSKKVQIIWKSKKNLLPLNV
jgi:hypothetical protein